MALRSGFLVSVFIAAVYLLVVALFSSAQQIDNVVIVYNCFIYTGNRHWLKLINEQLKHLKEIGLAERANSIYAMISIDNPKSDDMKNALYPAVEAIRSIIPNVRIEITLENRWEFPGA